MTPQLMRILSTAGSSSCPSFDTQFVRRASWPSIQSVPAASANMNVASRSYPLSNSTMYTGTMHNLMKDITLGMVKMRLVTASVF